jgi:hypothetical protein
MEAAPGFEPGITVLQCFRVVSSMSHAESRGFSMYLVSSALMRAFGPFSSNTESRCASLRISPSRLHRASHGATAFLERRAKGAGRLSASVLVADASESLCWRNCHVELLPPWRTKRSPRSLDRSRGRVDASDGLGFVRLEPRCGFLCGLGVGAHPLPEIVSVRDVVPLEHARRLVP